MQRKGAVMDNKKGINRRTVLKGLGAGAGLALTGGLSSAAYAAYVPAVPAKWDRAFDVIVIGTGYAGLSAAIEAHDAGAKVVVIEKAKVYGGNSLISTGAYNCVDPERQKKAGVEDSTDLHFRQTMAGGDHRNDPVKVRYFVENALDGLKWLESLGIAFEDYVYTIVGALWPRTHDPVKKGRGAAIAQGLKRNTDDRKIPILMDTKLVGIVREKPLQGDVLGVEVESGNKRQFIKANKAVVMATGGFGADVPFRVKYDSRLDEQIPTTNVPWATGEALVQAQNIGADVIGMDYIQLLVSCNYLTKKFGDMPNNGIDHAVFLNFKGERFIAEDARRDILSDASLAQPEKAFIWLCDDQAQKRYAPDITEKLFERELSFRTNTLEEMAKIFEKRFNTPVDKFLASVARYNALAKAGEDTDFGKNPVNLKPVEKGPFFVGIAMAGTHHTMGGLRTKGVTGQVIDRENKIIPRLYAAGECTGGVHGTNRIGGNAIPDCIVFGRLTGKNAAKETSKS